MLVGVAVRGPCAAAALLDSVAACGPLLVDLEPPVAAGMDAACASSSPSSPAPSPPAWMDSRPSSEWVGPRGLVLVERGQPAYLANIPHLGPTHSSPLPTKHHKNWVRPALTHFNPQFKHMCT